jgi:hypothetical protein
LLPLLALPRELAQRLVVQLRSGGGCCVHPRVYRANGGRRAPGKGTVIYGRRFLECCCSFLFMACYNA